MDLALRQDLLIQPPLIAVLAEFGYRSYGLPFILRKTLAQLGPNSAAVSAQVSLDSLRLSDLHSHHLPKTHSKRTTIAAPYNT